MNLYPHQFCARVQGNNDMLLSLSAEINFSQRMTPLRRDLFTHNVTECLYQSKCMFNEAGTIKQYDYLQQLPSGLSIYESNKAEQNNAFLTSFLTGHNYTVCCWCQAFQTILQR